MNVLGMWWPNIISNNNLWQQIKQDNVDTEIKKET